MQGHLEALLCCRKIKSSVGVNNSTSANSARESYKKTNAGSNTNTGIHRSLEENMK